MTTSQPAPRRRVSVARLIIVLLILAAILAVRPIVNDNLRTIVSDVFTEGTGCKTTIESARLIFLPIGAEAENAAIRCPGEDENSGFTAEKVTIRLNPLKLLAKKIFLQDLHITGARVKSIGTESSLIRVVEFVTDKPTPKPQSARKWHSFISSGWKVELSGLEISSASASDFDTPPRGGNTELWQSPELIIGVDDFVFAWKDVRFTATHTEHKYDFARLFGRAGSFGIKRGGADGILLGYLDAGVQIADGKLKVLHAYTSYGPPAGQPEVSRLTATGGMDIRDRSYDFHARAELYPPFLATVIPGGANFVNSQELKSTIEGDVTGKLADPIFNGGFNFRVSKPLALFQQEECSLKRIESKIKITTDYLHLYDIQVDELITSSDVSLQLEGDYAFTADLDYAVRRESSLVEKCLAATDYSGEQWMDVTLRNAVANSRGNISARGTMSPLFADGSILSHFHNTDVSDKATLRSSFKYSDGALRVSLKERGDIAQVRETPLPEADSGTSRSTAFQTTTNANIDLALLYDFASGRLELEQCRLKRYPMSRLLARLAPFLPQRILANASDFVTDETLIDFNLKLARKSANDPWVGGGSLGARPLEYHGFPIAGLDAPFSIRGEKFSLPDISASSSFGKMNGSLQLGKNDSIDGSFRLDVFDLSYVPWWKDVMPDITAALQGIVEVRGTTNDPKITGEVQIQPTTDMDTPIELVSYASFKTKKDALVGTAKLFGDRGSAEWSYPLGSNSKAPLKINFKADEFPVVALFPSHIRKLLSEQPTNQSGRLTGHLRYEAPPQSLSRGSGELVIDSLHLSTPSAQIKNAEPTQIKIVSGAFSIPDAVFLANDRELVIGGSVSPNDGWNLRLNSNWELGALTSMIREFEQLSGDLEVSAEVSGPFGDPKFDGKLKLRGGTVSLKFGDTFVGADRLEADARLSGDTLQLQRLEGEIGQGHIAAQGRLDQLLSASSRNGAIEIVMTGVSVQPSDVLSVRFSGYTDIILQPSLPPLIKGEIEVLGALYERNASLGDVIEAALSMLRDQQVAKAKRSVAADRNSARLDLRLHADESLQIESDILKATMRGDLRVAGTTSQPAIEGDIQVLEGSFGLSSSKFDILSGSISFPDNSLIIDPEITFAAETVVQTTSREEHRVLLTISGTARHPQVNMTTDSGMSEREIVGLLNIGGSTGSFSLLSWDQGRDDYTYAELLNPRSDISLQDRLKSLLGFSRFEIETRRRVETSELVPRVSGSREVTPDLSFTLYSDVGNSSNEQGATLDYELTPYLGAFGEWRSEPITKTESSTGVFGGGIIFRRSFPGTGIIPGQLVED